MKTNTNIIADSKIDNKIESYLSFGQELIIKANDIACSKKGFIMMKLYQEVESNVLSAKNADCEFMTYAKTNAAECYLNQMIQYKETGKIEL